MADVELMVKNCEYYNEPDSELVDGAKQLFTRCAVRCRELGPKLLDLGLTPKDTPKLLKVIKTLKMDPNADIFATPVPLVDPDIPGYAEKIARPIDLSEILGRISAKAKDPYATIYAFVEDVVLVWENCRSYNGKVRSHGFVCCCLCVLLWHAWTGILVLFCVANGILVWPTLLCVANTQDHYLYTIANRLENLFVKEFLAVLGKRVK